MNFNFSEIMSFLSVATIPFLMAITVHEASHGFAAYALGDNTAKNAGRLTLNPIKHIDVLGLAVLLLTRMIGWAKPVPVDFRIIARRKYGPLCVAIAGPASNLILAVISAIALYIVLAIYGDAALAAMFPGLPTYNTPQWLIWLVKMLQLSIQINIVLCIFNLLPILPMDGGRILHNLLPPHLAFKYAKLEPYGMIILLVLVFTGIIRYILSPVLMGIMTFILKIVIGGVS